MATVRELITKFGFDVDDGPLKRLDSSVDSMKSSLIKVTALAGAASAALISTAKATASYGDEIAKTSRQIGVQADSLQELRHAAQLGGASTQDLDNGVRRFSRSIVEAKDGQQTYVDALAKVGITTADLNDKNLTTEELMAKVADRFKDMPDGAEKTAAAMEVFGRAGTKLIPMLSQGSEELAKQRKEARDLGVVMDGDTLKASEDFTDELLRFNQVITGVRNAVGAKLLPMFIKLGKRFRSLFMANKALIVQKIDVFFQGLVEFLEKFVKTMTVAFTVVNRVAQAFGGWQKIIEAVMFGMLALTAAQMLSALGNMAIAVFSIVKAFRTLNLAATLANAKMLLIPLLIGAAIAGLILVFEDVLAFFRGEKSITGQIVQSFQEMFTWLEEKFSSFGGTVKTVIAVLLTPLRSFITTLRTAVNAAMQLKEGNISGAFKAVSQGFQDIVMPDTSSLSSVLGVASSSAQPASQVNVDSPITVQVPPNTPPDQVAEATKQGVKESLSQLFNETNRQIASPIVE